MMKPIAALAALAVAAPAMAVTYDVGTAVSNTRGVFSFGTVSSTGGFTAFGTADCSNINVGTTCYRGNDTFQVIFQSNNTTLLVHPGPGSTSAVLFTAPTASTYTFDGTFRSADSGIKTAQYSINGGALIDIGNLSGTSTQAVLQVVQLQAGQTFAFVVDNFDGYNSDSTQLTGTASAVPEPASWAMLMVGFGLVGAAARSRRVRALA